MIRRGIIENPVKMNESLVKGFLRDLNCLKALCGVPTWTVKGGKVTAWQANARPAHL